MKINQIALRLLFGLVGLLFLACIALILSGNAHLIKAVASTYMRGETGPTIDDYSKFENRLIKANQAKNWAIDSSFKKPSKALILEAEKWETSSLLLIKNKRIIYESYWGDYGKKSLTNSFSMSKSFVSLAIGVAIKSGAIKSLNQVVSDFLPEFKTEDKKNIRIIDLLQMSSGIDFGESYGDPFGFMAKAYYGSELYQLTTSKPVVVAPQTIWKYQGGNTLLLSFIIQQATGMTLSEYFEKEVWQKVGASEDALWTISDKDKRERAYCCFYSNARDFARIGQLYLDSGSWNGKQIIDKNYYKLTRKPVNLPDEEGKIIDYYGLHWWLSSFRGQEFFYARGILGQYIVVVPGLDLVFVRLGHKRDNTPNVEVPEDLYVYLKIAFELAG